MRSRSNSRETDKMKAIPRKKQTYMMTLLGVLLDGNLSDVHGERECGPNGAKSTFLRNGKEFLRGLGHDLEFAQARVYVNPAGIAVSGDVLLYGMWGEKNGLMVEMSQMCSGHCLMYRKINDLKDSSHSFHQNHFLDPPYFMAGYYEELLNILRRYRDPFAEPLQAAA